MSIVKRILKSSAVQSVACLFIAGYMGLVRLTGRWTFVGDANAQAHWQSGKPFILALWHGRLLMMSTAWPKGIPVHMLISQHRDGQLIARTIGYFGVQTIAGSSSKGGATALRKMVKTLKSGEYVGITPDGPRGPRMHASDGVVAVARLAGVPVIPSAYGVRGRKVLGTWDRFVLPGLFSRGVFVFGDAIAVSKEDEPEAVRKSIEDALNAVTAEADRLTGHDPIAPAVLEPTE